MLADPDDVAAGHVTRFRRADPEHVVRSREQAHPAIVSVETFTQTQLLRASRAAGGLDGRRKLEHGLHPAKHNYVLRGRIRCGYCSRKMEGAAEHGRGYYRCVTRRLAPGSPTLATHPRNVYLPERAVLPALNAWIGELFNRDNIDQTVAALLEFQDGSHGPAAPKTPRSTGTRSSGGWPTPRCACRASVPRSRPEPTQPRWSSRSTPPRNSAPPRRPNSA